MSGLLRAVRSSRRRRAADSKSRCRRNAADREELQAERRGQEGTGAGEVPRAKRVCGGRTQEVQKRGTV